MSLLLLKAWESVNESRMYFERIGFTVFSDANKWD